MNAAGRFRPALRIAVVLIAGSVLAGCSLTELFTRGAQEHRQTPETIYATAPLHTYLTMLQNLIHGDPAKQATITQDAEAAATSIPTPANRLRLALVLGTPGHAASDPKQATKLLQGVLTSTTGLSPEERALAAIQLQGLEQQLARRATAAQATRKAAAEAATREAKNARRLKALTDSNEALQKALNDAEQKLQAITNIERSIRNRENGADPR